MFGWTRVVTLVAVAAAVAIVTGGAGATSTSTPAGGARATSTSTPAGGARATSTSTLAPATVSHRATAGKVSTAASRRGTLLRTANLSTQAGAARYLRAIGVDPRGLVIQRGARNYAGSNCPGAGWACASTAHAVVQIARAGGKNRFACGAVHCAVVQVALARAVTNTAKCIKTTGLGQSCSINQSNASADNQAIVYEDTGSKMSGLTQTASSTATITQQATGSSNKNQACVHQAISVEGSTNLSGKKAAVTVTLEAHQSIVITQDANGSGVNPGGNTVQDATPTGGCGGDTLSQSQTLNSRVTGTGAVTQNENASSGGPNVSLDIKQNQSPGFFGLWSGPNTAKFNQTNSLTAAASTPVGFVHQTQSSATGGILATINQDSTGVNTANANQTETQCEDAYKSSATTLPTCSLTESDSPGFSSGLLIQTQSGPIGNAGAPRGGTGGRRLAFVKKGDGTSVQTGGNSGNQFIVIQSSTQRSDAGSTQTNNVQGDCQTSGTCTVTQTTNVNGTSSTNTESGQSVDTQTTCSGSTCTSSGPSTTGTLTTLTNGFSVSNTDVGEFGYGGMRSSGTGSITVNGVPTGSVFHAFLYWNGPTNSTDPDSNKVVTFNGMPITGTNIGTASDNSWTYLNGQSYRADVTSLVPGTGSYGLSNFIKTDESNNIVADINGAALIVLYDDGNSSNDRNVVLWNGNDSNVTTGPPYNADGWDETLTNVPYPGSGSASLDLVVSDGQNVFADDALVVNGSTIAAAGAIFSGDSTPANAGQSTTNGGSLWDIKPFDITSLLSEGSSNSLEITTGVNQDYLSLVVAIANVPASAPVIP
jgi:hypothetical protein